MSGLGLPAERIAMERLRNEVKLRAVKHDDGQDSSFGQYSVRS
jgi:hypothetical protein